MLCKPQKRKIFPVITFLKEKGMEFLAILFFLASLGVLVFKPQKEKLAFSLLWIATGICFGLYMVASINSILPSMAY